MFSQYHQVMMVCCVCVTSCSVPMWSSTSALCLILLDEYLHCMLIFCPLVSTYWKVGINLYILLVNIEMYGCFCICCNCVYEGFDDQLLKLMLVKRSSLGVAVEENVIQKQQPNIKTSSSILEILSMVWAYNLFLFIYNHTLVSIYHRVPLLY